MNTFVLDEHQVAMSGHNAPSPAPRSASAGPNGPLTTPTSVPLVNGVGSVSASGSSAPVPAAGGSATSGGMSQQNLNQIVSTFSGFCPRSCVLVSGRKDRM